MSDTIFFRAQKQIKGSASTVTSNEAGALGARAKQGLSAIANSKASEPAGKQSQSKLQFASP